MRFGGVIALCRLDTNGLAIDPAGLDVSRLSGSAVVFGEKTSDGRVDACLGVVNKILVIPLEACPGVLERPVIGPADNITDTVVYVEWETGGGKWAQQLERDFEVSQLPGNRELFSMGCVGTLFEQVDGVATKLSIHQAVVQPKGTEADPLQAMWRLKE